MKCKTFKILFEEILKSKFFEVSGLICSKFSNFNSDYENLAKVAKKNRINFKFVKNINENQMLNGLEKKS